MAIPVVFDCMVFLQAAARRTSIAAGCLELAENRHVELCLTEEILAEISDVLRRPELRARFPALTEGLVNDFIGALRSFGHLYPAPAKRFSYERDPKDEPYLNLAIEAQATYLVSRDKDILDLGTSVEAPALDFQKRFPQIRLMEPLSFLRSVRAELQGGKEV